jgi:hypothetical protein
MLDKLESGNTIAAETLKQMQAENAEAKQLSASGAQKLAELAESRMLSLDDAQKASIVQVHPLPTPPQLPS